MPVVIKIYHIFQKRCTALIIKAIKTGRYFLDGDIYQAISQLCCEILVGVGWCSCLGGALLYLLIHDYLVGALDTSAPPTSAPPWRT